MQVHTVIPEAGMSILAALGKVGVALYPACPEGKARCYKLLWNLI